jgi:hypothetical protein
MRNVFSRPQVTPPIARDGWPSPDPGDDTFAVMEELGYNEDDLDVMVRRGAISDRNRLFPTP